MRKSAREVPPQVEGRVAIHHVEPKDTHKNFAFKCHRETVDGGTGRPAARGVALAVCARVKGDDAGDLQHLLCECHLLSPPGHVRDSWLRRRLQLLGQGLQAAAYGLQEGKPGHLLCSVLAFGCALRLCALLRLVSRLGAPRAFDAEPDHAPQSPEGRDYAAEQEAGPQVGQWTYVAVLA